LRQNISRLEKGQGNKNNALSEVLAANPENLYSLNANHFGQPIPDGKGHAFHF